jgi:hypothetical protein
MVRRKNSLNYIEFIRGKYDVNNIQHLTKVFGLMTRDENLKIASSNFDQLWNELWKKTAKSKIYQKEFYLSKLKFEELKGLTLSRIEGGIGDDEIIFTDVLGNEYNHTDPIFNDPKIVIRFHSPDISLYERPALNHLIEDANILPEFYVLYMHSKGVKHVTDITMSKYVYDWCEYMFYFRFNKKRNPKMLP